MSGVKSISPEATILAAQRQSAVLQPVVPVTTNSL
jgi:hypothetical protein